MPDKNDAAFDLMARQLGTHVIKDPALLWEYQADVTQLITHSEVAFAAVLPDGTIILRCPNGLPEDLAAVAEPFKPLTPPAAPSSLEEKLALIERKLDGLIADQVEREQMLDRLDAVEFALQDRVGASEEDGPAPADIAAMLHLLAQKQDALALSVAQKLEPELLAQSVANLEDRLMAALQVQAVPDLSTVISAVEAAVAALAVPSADPAPLETLLAKVEELVHRPVPIADLTAQHQAITKFLISLGSATTRLEEATDTLSSLHDKALPSQVSDIIAAVQSLETRIDNGPDWSPLVARLEGLKDSGTAEGLALLAAQISRLAQRPDPVLDLTAQRQSFAAFGNALSRTIDRLESVSDALETRAEPGISGPQGGDIAALFDRLEVRSDSATATLRELFLAISALGQRPDPVLDLTAQRQSFAAFAQALSRVVSRLEGVSDALQTHEAQPAREVLERLDRIEAGLAVRSEAPEDRRDTLVEALLQLAAHLSRQPVASPQASEAQMVLFRVAQDELLQDLRFAFAELIATQLRAQSMAA